MISNVLHYCVTADSSTLLSLRYFCKPLLPALLGTEVNMMSNDTAYTSLARKGHKNKKQPNGYAALVMTRLTRFHSSSIVDVKRKMICTFQTRFLIYK